MDWLLKPRKANLLGALTCAGLMGFALYAQHGLGLEPCPLCVFQRVAVIALGVVFALAALHGPRGAGRIVYGLLAVLAAAGGAGVAGRHAWLQSLPPDQVPACGPGLDFMLDTFGLGEALRMVLSGSGECAEVAWSFLGLSMPLWVLLWCVSLGIFAAWVNWRRPAVAG
jgi:disulfide bond formation protein DsbB